VWEKQPIESPVSGQAGEVMRKEFAAPEGDWRCKAFSVSLALFLQY